MKAYGIGRFVSDPELKQYENTHVCNFTLAVNEYRKDREGNRKEYTNFFDFVIWDKAAELIKKYKVKGDQIFIKDATARQDKWVDNNGQNRSKVVFRVNDFEFVGYRQRQETESNTTEQQEEEEPF